STPPSTVQISNTVTYSITLSNSASGVDFGLIAVTNTFFVLSTNQGTNPIQLVSASPTNNVIVASNTFTFFLFQLLNGATTNLTSPVPPKYIETLTTKMADTATTKGPNNPASTTIVPQVTSTGTTNPPVNPVSLSVAFTPPRDDVFAKDLIGYGLTV